jgi:hypothetical protein
VQAIQSGEADLEELDTIFKKMGFELAYLIDKTGKFTIDWEKTVFVGFDNAADLVAQDHQKGKKFKPIKVDEEIDRYHEIKEELSDIENNLNRISKAKDRAFGADKLKFMREEREELER